jgi:hypothetical protein
MTLGMGFYKMKTIGARYYRGISVHYLAIISVIALEFGSYELIYERMSEMCKEHDIITYCCNEYSILNNLRRVLRNGIRYNKTRQLDEIVDENHVPYDRHVYGQVFEGMKNLLRMGDHEVDLRIRELADFN